MRISFTGFVVDLDQRRLLAGDREVHLGPKAFELLKLLIENRPKALAKDEIFQRLWPDTFVTENNLATLIGDLRSALGDDAHQPRFIRTVYAFGYAFAAEATEQGASGEGAGTRDARWKLIHEHREIPLNPGENILGRTGPGVIVLDSATVSRHHARLSIAGDEAIVEDLGSKNGTWVGETPVTGPTVVRDGDELRLGSVVVVVRVALRTPSTQTVEYPGA